MNYLDQAMKYFEKSCTPSQIYLAIAVVSILFNILENMTKKNGYHILGIRIPGISAILVFLLQVLYVFAWSWFLNFLCKKGYTNISWFLVLLPYVGVLIAVIISLIMMSRIKM